MIGGHFMKGWSRIRIASTLSSAVVDLVAAVKRRTGGREAAGRTSGRADERTSRISSIVSIIMIIITCCILFLLLPPFSPLLHWYACQDCQVN